MNLEEARTQIDAIDKELLALFERRMNTAMEVARYKKENGLTVFDSTREQQILARVQNEAEPTLSGYAVSFWLYVMDLSKAMQREVLVSDSPGAQMFRSLTAQTRQPLPHPRVTVQGLPGAYSHQAAMQLYPDGTIAFAKSWSDVLYAVQEGSCDYGVLPIENSAAGSVAEVYDLMREFKFYIVKAWPLTVRHTLLGVRGAKLKNIRKVYSHPHAFPQCGEFFRQHHRMELIPYTNTAMAAEYVARLGDETCAALCSRECAQLYGLDVLAENIQQTQNNCTRFVSVSRRLEIPEDANKISLLFSLPHVNGSLCRTLMRFAHCGLNLTKIESRPNLHKSFEYIFYVDFTGRVNVGPTATLLGALSDELADFHFLGNYSEPRPQP